MIGKKMIETIHLGIPGKVNFSKEMDGMEYFIRVEDFDKYTLVLSEIGILNTRLKNHIEIETFENLAHSLEDRLSYFPGHPKLLEVDRKDLIALLRSSLPEKEEGITNYYEILFSKAKKIQFYRIANQIGLKEKVKMVIPDDIFARLIDDFTDILHLNN